MLLLQGKDTIGGAPLLLLLSAAAAAAAHCMVSVGPAGLWFWGRHNGV
jgi:hypothetical protein